MPENLVPLIEAAYALTEDENEWLTGLCRAARSVLDHDLGITAIQYDATKDAYVDLVGMGSIETDPQVLNAMFGTVELEHDEQLQLVQIFRRRGASTMRRAIHRMPRFARDLGHRLASAARPDADYFGVVAADPSCRGILLAAFTDRRLDPHPRTIARWSRAAAHIATGWRIRQRLSALQGALLTESPETEAIFDPSGRVVHAVGGARSVDSRQRLRSAVVAFERLRRRGTDPDKALALWEALVDGRWSLLDCFDHDGRRYWVAHRNEPNVPPIVALTERERQVAAYAALGQSNKLIAYELGISIASVARDLRTARAKLGVASRVELVRALRANPSLTGPLVR